MCLYVLLLLNVVIASAAEPEPHARGLRTSQEHTTRNTQHATHNTQHSHADSFIIQAP